LRIAETVQQPMLQELYRIMRFRTSIPVQRRGGDRRKSRGRQAYDLWRNGADSARLTADFTIKAFTITTSDETGETHVLRQER
jgi:hypothetical protein